MTSSLRATKLFWAEAAKFTNTPFNYTNADPSDAPAMRPRAYSCPPASVNKPGRVAQWRSTSLDCVRPRVRKPALERRAGWGDRDCTITFWGGRWGTVFGKLQVLLKSNTHNTNSNKNLPKGLYAKSNHLRWHSLNACSSWNFRDLNKAHHNISLTTFSPNIP